MRQNDPNRQAKFQHLHEQAVHDEQGRRRFHGAFTGGFSAGYYNTVGSEEEPMSVATTKSVPSKPMASMSSST